jgi:hypothetical protein
VTAAPKETFAHQAPRAPGHQTRTPGLPVGPTPGTFSISAPTLGAVGTAAVKTDAVDGDPATGAIANKTMFSAPTATGAFTLQQVVQRSGEGVVSANLLAQLPTPLSSSTTAIAQTYSSDVSTSPTQDGNVLVNVRLLVVPPSTSTAPVDNATALDINVQAVYTPDVTQVLAETVRVVEGSAPCCDSPASTTPPNTTNGNGTSSLPLAPTAVGSASVSPMSTTRSDDQASAPSS